MPQLPKCEVCGEIATHHSTKIVNGQLEEHHFCAEHVAKEPSFLAQPAMQISLEQLLGSLLSQAAKAQEDQTAAPENDMRCGVCRLPFSLYRKTMILGCDRCYESFEEQLTRDLRKIHGATRHTGRRPPRFKPNPTRARAKPVVLPAEAAAKAPAAAKLPAAKETPGQSATVSLDDRIQKARAAMQEAVKAQDFEKAAQLRDLIKQMQAERAQTAV